MQNRDLVRDHAYESHVMLDHHDRPSPRDRVQKRRRLLPFLRAHSCHRLVKQQKLGVLHQQHPDFQPLFLSVAELRGFVAQHFVKVNLVGNLVDFANQLRVALEEQRTENAALPGVRDFQVLEDRQILVYGWILKFPADADARNLILDHLRELVVLEPDSAVGWLGLAADHVQQRGFARTIWTNDTPQFVFLDIERQIVHGLESVKRHAQILYREDHFAHFPTSLRSPSDDLGSLGRIAR